MYIPPPPVLPAEFPEKVQLVTAPELTDYIERLLGLSLTGKLSTAALETLAIVAYRQPITRPEIEAIRGVNSDGVLRTLLSKGLVEEVGAAMDEGIREELEAFVARRKQEGGAPTDF